MTVCVVGAGGREHALARVLARSADVVVTPGNPGMPGLQPRGPPDQRHRGAAGRGRGRPGGGRAPRPRWSTAWPTAARRRAPGARARRRRGPARGVQGLHERAARRGRRAHRPLRGLRARRRGGRLPAGPCRGPGWSRPTAWPPARGSSSPTAGTRPRPTWRPSCRARPSARPAGGWWSRRAWSGPSAPCSSCATAAGSCPWPRPRTSSGSATATPGPTPAGWGPTRRSPASART